MFTFVPATASAQPMFAIPAGRLAEAVPALARTANVEIIYAPHLLEGLPSPAVRGKMSVARALRRLLDGSGVTFERTSDGVFALRRSPPAPEPVPEILVIGRRSQDVDIRRGQDDVQNHRVAQARDIANAHTDSLDDYLRMQLPGNTQNGSAIQRGTSARSQIALRGLGTRRTLILVDGRRMPSLPEVSGDFGQPDIGSIPQSAIDRVEILTSTANGIYGPDAMGGVVNVVLRRDLRGAEVNIFSGGAEDGGARRLRIEASIGFSPDDGRTTVSIDALRSIRQPSMLSANGVGQRLRRLNAATGGPLAELAPLGNAIEVRSLGGELVLKPETGGTNLGATHSFLPIGFGGTQAQRVDLLRTNAGRYDPRLARRSGDLEIDPTQTAVLGNVRRDFGHGVEGFVDVISLRSKSLFASQEQGQFIAAADSPANPFAVPVTFRFPLSEQATRTETIASTRATIGIITRLPAGWSANADASLGNTHLRHATLSHIFTTTADGAGTDGAAAPFDPLGEPGAFLAARSRLVVPIRFAGGSDLSFSDIGLRLAGPVARLPGGPATLTVSAERRAERVTEVVYAPQPTAHVALGLQRTVGSLYAETLAPLGRDAHDAGLLRGLELQLATRYDMSHARLPADLVNDPAAPASDEKSVSSRFGTLTFTAGARSRPLRWLLLRASVATGRLPPAVSDLSVSRLVSTSPPDVGDPARGGRIPGSEGPITEIMGGSYDPGPERATTIAAGIVLGGEDSDGPRLSIDYSRIRIARALGLGAALDIGRIFRDPALAALRVARAPLTVADAAQGFTGGRVLSIDRRPADDGGVIATAIDFRFDWRVPLPGGDRLTLGAGATWQPLDLRRPEAGRSWVNYSGHADGALPWRAVGTIEWIRGRTTLGLNTQWFGDYRATLANPGAADYNRLIASGARTGRVPAQAYLDLFATRRFPIGRGGSDLVVRAGVQNVFDRIPPFAADNLLQGYSYYGDPRGRRFQLALTLRR